MKNLLIILSLIILTNCNGEDVNEKIPSTGPTAQESLSISLDYCAFKAIGNKQEYLLISVGGTNFGIVENTNGTVTVFKWLALENRMFAATSRNEYFVKGSEIKDIINIIKDNEKEIINP